MQRNTDDEGIGLLTEEESEAPSPAPAPSAPAVSAPVPQRPTPTPPRPEAPGLLDLKPADDATRDVTAGNVTTLTAVITSRHPMPGSATIHTEIAYTSTYPGEGAEWPVSWLLPGKKNYAELEIGRASCRERVEGAVGGVAW